MSEREKGREGKGRCGESQLTMRGGLTARIRCDKTISQLLTMGAFRFIKRKFAHLQSRNGSKSAFGESLCESTFRS